MWFAKQESNQPVRQKAVMCDAQSGHKVGGKIPRVFQVFPEP